MSILIKGMEMPQNCGDCPLFESKYHYHGCHAVPESFSVLNMWDFVGEKPSWCPLIELPPHGRLVDIDRLFLEVNNLINSEKGILQIVSETEKLIRNAPIVVESEDASDKD